MKHQEVLEGLADVASHPQAITDTINEISSNDPTGTKVASILGNLMALALAFFSHAASKSKA